MTSPPFHSIMSFLLECVLIVSIVEFCPTLNSQGLGRWWLLTLNEYLLNRWWRQWWENIHLLFLAHTHADRIQKNQPSRCMFWAYVEVFAEIRKGREQTKAVFAPLSPTSFGVSCSRLWALQTREGAYPCWPSHARTEPLLAPSSVLGQKYEGPAWVPWLLWV